MFDVSQSDTLYITDWDGPYNSEAISPTAF